MYEELQSYGDHAPTIELYQPGLPCLALSSDGNWYRGRLLDTVSLRKENDVIHEVGAVNDVIITLYICNRKCLFIFWTMGTQK